MILKEIINILFPPKCAICGSALIDGVDDICLRCRWEMPVTNYCFSLNNPVSDLFKGHIPLVTASSYFFFIHNGKWRKLIHRFKYHNGWRLAEIIGQWYGEELHKSPHYQDIDLIIPIPLHPLKKIKRGYNQSEYIAHGVSKHLGATVETRAVKRIINNNSQTSKHYQQRWNNVKGAFYLRRPELLAGKHILIVDDVLTTGSTIISCAEAILQRQPNVRISIITLSIAQKQHKDLSIKYRINRTLKDL